jgi:hypothetical protein
MAQSRHHPLRLSHRSRTTGGLRLRRLVLLTTYRISPGETDVRGWIVFTEDGQRVGRVRDLIIDVQNLVVRYVEVDLDWHFAESGTSTRAIVPVACARVSAQRRHVHVRGIRSDELCYAPSFGARPIGTEEETSVRRFFLRGGTALPANDSADARALALLEQQRFFGVRRQGRWDDPYLCRAVEAPLG